MLKCIKETLLFRPLLIDMHDNIKEIYEDEDGLKVLNKRISTKYMYMQEMLLCLDHIFVVEVYRGETKPSWRHITNNLILEILMYPCCTSADFLLVISTLHLVSALTFGSERRFFINIFPYFKKINTLTIIFEQLNR